MLYKKYTIVAFLISVLVTPVFCAQQKEFNSHEYETDELLEKLFDKKKAKNPEAIYKGIRILVNDSRFDKDSIVKLVNTKLNYPSFDALVSDYKKTVVYYAAEAGDRDAIEIIFSIWQGDPWTLLKIRETHYGYTPLQIAVVKGHKKTVGNLLKLSGNNAWTYITMKTNNTWPALTLAAEYNRKDIFSDLLKYCPNEATKENLLYEAEKSVVYWFEAQKSANAGNY
jgi:hypothetical protein